MKKKILLVTAVVICLAIAATGTLAYFTSDDVAHNVITSGGVNIELVEKTEGEDGTLVEIEYEFIDGEIVFLTDELGVFLLVDPAELA